MESLHCIHKEEWKRQIVICCSSSLSNRTLCHFILKSSVCVVLTTAWHQFLRKWTMKTEMIVRGLLVSIVSNFYLRQREGIYFLSGPKPIHPAQLWWHVRSLTCWRFLLPCYKKVGLHRKEALFSGYPPSSVSQQPQAPWKNIHYCKWQCGFNAFNRADTVGNALHHFANTLKSLFYFLSQQCSYW